MDKIILSEMGDSLSMMMSLVCGWRDKLIPIKKEADPKAGFLMISASSLVFSYPSI